MSIRTPQRLSAGTMPYPYEVPFSPEYLNGAQLWLDAAHSSTITLDGSNNIEVWGDKSGNGRNAIQTSSGVRAGYDTSGTRNIVTLNGVDQFLYIDGWGSVDTSDDFTYIAVVNLSESLTLGFIMAQDCSDFVREPFMAYALSDFSSSDDWVFGPWQNDTTNRVARSSRTSNQAILIGTKASGSPAKLWHDGAENSAGASADQNRTTDLQIGRRTSGNYFEGDIYEIMVFGHVINDDERQKIEGYFAHKWGLTSNLSAEHPYKNTESTVTLGGADVIYENVSEPQNKFISNIILHNNSGLNDIVDLYIREGGVDTQIHQIPLVQNDTANIDFKKSGLFVDESGAIVGKSNHEGINYLINGREYF